MNKNFEFYNKMSEEEFNYFFVMRVLESNSLECFDEETARYLIDAVILPITGWEKEVVEEANIKTVMFWYLMRIFYLDNDRETLAARMIDEIYLFFDGLYLK